MVNQIYSTRLQLNKTNIFDTKALFSFGLVFITNGIVSHNMYDKRDNLNFEIVNFQFLDEDVPRCPTYCVHVYFSQLIRFVSDRKF